MKSHRHSFSTNVCPLCHRVLHLKRVAGVSVFACHETIELETAVGRQLQSHYEVECDASETIQHVYTMPFCIDNYASTNVSKIWRFNNTTKRPWEFVADTPSIYSNDVEVMLNNLSSFFANAR